MTNPGDSDEWWKQYGGEGVSSESGGHAQVPPSGPPSAPQQQPQPPVTPPPQQQYPSYPQQQPPQYGQQPYGQQEPYPQQPQQPYGQPGQYGQPNPYGQPAYPPGGAYQPYGYPQQQAQGTNGLAIGSLIASILGLCTCIGAIVGIVLGIIALNQIKERGGEGRGLALAGIWVGAAAIVLQIIWVVVNIAISA
ncbi:DUF4190 domain-containing protein [Nocardia mexicana]|uniref:Uncharacterized protein DUF4190 n=1 Tax=Nocardia mexicana TaxID=279262 RepID=A0A370GJM8_9NOCA|nr:DUF4190 domain-containing protein [Nocardia mexicana]RDI43837.1 uncharacterized protein DUF4190 [Nocardia mexicana]